MGSEVLCLKNYSVCRELTPFWLGIMRAFLVYPTYITFPNLLPTVQLFDALHRGKKIFLQKKRVQFFWFTFVGIFIWEWFPEYIAP
jgi:OPT oligopeptide transporter protein